MEITIKNTSDTEVEITGTLAIAEVEEHKNAALKSLGKNVSLPGFRKGKIPTKTLEGHIGAGPLWQEMCERALSASYPKIIKEHNLNVIGRPDVSITKMAPGNPLEFKLTTAVMPTFDLPDYTAIAKKENKTKEDLTVSENDVADALLNIRKQFGAMEAMKNLKEGEKPDTSKEPEPVDLTDELVKQLGPFKDVADFTEKLKVQLAQEKETKARDKKRMQILDAVLAKTKLTLPDVVVQAEIGKMAAQFQSEVERSGMKYDDYIKQTGKTKEDMEKEWRPDAEKRAKIQIILNRIAAEEKIMADPAEVKKHVSHLMDQQKEHDKNFTPTKEAEMNATIYVESLLINDKVFEWLEEQK